MNLKKVDAMGFCMCSFNTGKPNRIRNIDNMLKAHIDLVDQDSSVELCRQIAKQITVKILHYDTSAL